MALETIRLYYNTGFKMGEVPDSPTLLNTCTYLDLETHFDYQEQFLATLDIKATYDQVKNADYLKFGSTYYFISGIQMLNKNNARVTLQLDALTTLGGPANLNYNGGIVHQCHSTTDDYLLNVIEPKIGCSQILEMVGRTQTVPITGKNIIASTLDLSEYPPKDASNINGAYYFKTNISVPGTDEAIVAVPQGLSAAISTDIGSSNNTVGFGYYDADNVTVKANIKFLRDLGIEGAILYSYVVPTHLVTMDTTTDAAAAHGHITRVGTGNIVSATSFDTTITADYGTYNNKKTYTTYNQYVLQSVLSGDTQTYDVADITDANNAINFNIMYDGQYGGRAYCYPLYFKGIANTAFNLVRGVKSLPWKDYPIVFDTMSGSQWALNEYRTKYGDASRNLVSRVGGSMGSSGLGSVKSFFSDLYGSATNFITGAPIALTYLNDRLNNGGNAQEILNLADRFNRGANLDTKQYQIAKARAEYEQAQVIAPDLSCSPALGLQNIWSSQFLLIHLKPTATDLTRIDNYYTQYGYPQGNKVFEKSMLSGRQYFNYIEASDISIVRNDGAANAGIAVRQAAEAQLNAGVRIWHVLPQHVTSNPIV